MIFKAIMVCEMGYAICMCIGISVITCKLTRHCSHMPLFRFFFKSHHKCRSNKLSARVRISIIIVWSPFSLYATHECANMDSLHPVIHLATLSRSICVLFIQFNQLKMCKSVIPTGSQP